MKADQQKAFDVFWKEHWPKCRRIDKKKAAEVWAKIAPDKYPMIFAAVERQKKQASWLIGDCKFIPYPHRWLRDRRWEDELTLPEDGDAEVLIEALGKESTMPSELPKHIAERCRRMCVRTRTNWPKLHYSVGQDPDAGEKIKADYLATT